jgi:hypothetical protein
VGLAHDLEKDLARLRGFGFEKTFTCVTIQGEIVVIVGYSTCIYKPLDGPNI